MAPDDADRDEDLAEIIERIDRRQCDAGSDCKLTLTPFVTTKEHRRFVEFCDAVRRHRYIGLCYGPPGVGKTASARQCAAWEVISHWFEHGRNWHYEDPPAALLDRRTAVYTPEVTATPRILEGQIRYLVSTVSSSVEIQLHPDRGVLRTRRAAHHR